MSLASEPVFQYLSQFAYQPILIYLLVFGMMYLSSFGLPIPEEVTIQSVGFLSFMGTRPNLFPPPQEAGVPLDATSVAIVTSIAVLSSDLLIYSIGRIWGRRALEGSFARRVVTPDVQSKIQRFLNGYGMWAVGFFRFTPGLRFPGHLLCGCFQFPLWQFALVDAIAVILSVPTQILLIAVYGEEILTLLKTFKIVILSVLFLCFAIFILRRWSGRHSTVLERL